MTDWTVNQYGWNNNEFPDSLDVGELIADLKKITMRRNNKVSTLRTSQVLYSFPSLPPAVTDQKSSPFDSS